MNYYKAHLSLHNTYLRRIHSSEQIILKCQKSPAKLNVIPGEHKFNLLFDIFSGRSIAFCVHAQQEKGR